MADDITTIGAEFVVKYLFTDEVTKPADTTIGLYDSQTDTLNEDSDVGDITSEPSDGNYARLTYSFGTTDFTSLNNTDGDWQADFAEKTFDLVNTTGYADSYFEVLSFMAEGESATNPHLFTYGPLLDSQGEQMRLDLGSATSFDFSGSVIVP